jgi:hypothetical protein
MFFVGAMRSYERMGVQLHSFFILFDGGEWSTSLRSCFTPGKERERLNKGLCVPLVGVHHVETRKISFPCRESKCDSSII